MNKREIQRIARCKSAITELLDAVMTPKRFSWGERDGQSKMTMLAGAGFVLVSKSKLEKGGHRLKRNATPLGTIYYKAPLSRHTNLYLLGVQTERVMKWYDLYAKGKALVEDGTYGKKPLMVPVADCAKGKSTYPATPESEVQK